MATVRSRFITSPLTIGPRKRAGKMNFRFKYSKEFKNLL
ncbi:UNVERIFIED_ORG: hypothetical protein QOE_2505 [Clostridioides difficile F501]